MASRLFRSITQPIRTGLNCHELWCGPDRGLVWCWERGRQKRDEDPDLAARAGNGELVVLAWKGGLEKALKPGEKKLGTLEYLATWQGLRNEDLDLSLEEERVIVCSRTGQAVTFSAGQSVREE